MGRILALDVGSVRIGVAVSDPLGVFAQGIAVLPAEGPWLRRLEELVARGASLERIVEGLGLIFRDLWATLRFGATAAEALGVGGAEIPLLRDQAVRWPEAALSENTIAGRGVRPTQATAGQPPKPAATAKPKTYRKDEDSDPYVNVKPNDPCPCGSGKKFKKCHGFNR